MASIVQRIEHKLPELAMRVRFLLEALQSNVPGARQLFGVRQESKSGALFCQQTKTRAGAATEASDGEPRIVADSCWRHLEA